MENAAEAIKMAAAVLVFVGALAVAIIMIGQARATSDSILYMKDTSNYDSYTESDEAVTSGVVTAEGNRIVGLETIIPSLYRYYKEGFTIKFVDENNQKIILYEKTHIVTNPPETQEYIDWVDEYSSLGYTAGLNAITNRLTLNLEINYFDLADETSRTKINGAWTAGNVDDDISRDKQYTLIRKNIEYFLTGIQPVTGVSLTPVDLTKLADFRVRLQVDYAGHSFEEILSEIVTVDANNPNQSTKKRVITYKLIP